MNYLVAEFGFYATSAYMLAVSAVVALFVSCSIVRWKRHLDAKRFEARFRERRRMETVRWLVGMARDCSYRAPERVL